MSDYLIWIGEKLEKLYPDKSWEKIMDMAQALDISEHPGYSVETYLKEVGR